tara:strand:+ start:386 stop:538 length:153 start_codon:yes stop_codon:yes gene_type:complete
MTKQIVNWNNADKKSLCARCKTKHFNNEMGMVKTTLGDKKICRDCYKVLK